MARKSRKTINKEAEGVQKIAEQEEQGLLETAAYIRLSVENNGHESDGSLQTQITLVKDYIQKHPELRLEEIYIDNGYSGTKFDRPEFLRMMDDVKCGKIHCIVVKDLSRFGRDYLETGYYLENIFPLLNVRFIAITDNYDNSRIEDRESLAIPIKNMVNAMYAKDFSRKQGIFREMCIRTGRVMEIHAAYGYKFSKDEKNLIMDEETGMYVRLLFSWVLNGVKLSEIAKRLNIIGAPTPADTSTHNFAPHPWTNDTIKTILYNPVYAGYHVSGKRKVSIYEGIPETNIERDKWIYFPDFHEPYITEDEYQQIEKRIFSIRKEFHDQRETTKEDRKRLPDAFNKKIMCGDCNRPMGFERKCHHRGYRNLSYGYYRCKTLKKYGTCSNKTVQENYIKMIINDQIQNLLTMLVKKEELLCKLEKSGRPSEYTLQLQRKVMRLSNERTEIDEKITKAYMDLAEGLLEEAEYQTVKKRLYKRKAEVDAALKEAQEKYSNLQSEISGFKDRVEELKQHLVDDELDLSFMQELVDEVWVYENGARMEIKFNCEDLIQNAVVNEYIKAGVSNEDRVLLETIGI